jgi:C4-dicarboxylate-specific signal transduction histidine kinase
MSQQWYREVRDILEENEQICSKMEGESSFHVLVPFFPRGELIGAVYMKITPDFSDIVKEITSSYNETGALFSALILFGLLAMFYITSYTVRQRDNAQAQLFREREEQIKREIEHKKEAHFTRRIYHTHHKAEKVMGFIKEDLRQLNSDNLETIRERVTKYSNFVSRVIYDMKSYDPPLSVIRNPLFKTDINQVIRFIIDNIFKRVYEARGREKFHLDLDPQFPILPVNEYVIWEIIEPLIQNSIDHNRERDVTIFIRTSYEQDKSIGEITILDDGQGIDPSLLEVDERGIKRLFLEHTTTKDKSQNLGYGCYIAYEISRKCGWRLDAENGESGGARFVIGIPI